MFLASPRLPAFPALQPARWRAATGLQGSGWVFNSSLMQASKATPGGCRPSCCSQSLGRPSHRDDSAWGLHHLRLGRRHLLNEMFFRISRPNAESRARLRSVIFVSGPIEGSPALSSPKSSLRVYSSGTSSSAIFSPCVCSHLFLPLSSGLRVCWSEKGVGNCMRTFCHLCSTMCTSLPFSSCSTFIALLKNEKKSPTAVVFPQFEESA